MERHDDGRSDEDADDHEDACEDDCSDKFTGGHVGGMEEGYRIILQMTIQRPCLSIYNSQPSTAVAEASAEPDCPLKMK